MYGFSAITSTCSWANIFRAMCDASFYWLHFITQPCPPEHTLVTHPHIFAPLRSPMKTLETARTADCCDPTGGRLRSPGLILFFLSSSAEPQNYLVSAPNGSVGLGLFPASVAGTQATHCS